MLIYVCRDEKLEVVGNHKVVAISSVKTENGEMASNGTIFSSTYISFKVAKSMVNLTSNMVIYSGCLLVQVRHSHLKTTQPLMNIWQALETSHSKSNLGNFQHQYLPEILVNVYSYHVIVKVCHTVVCMKAGFPQSSHTYIYIVFNSN